MKEKVSKKSFIAFLIAAIFMLFIGLVSLFEDTERCRYIEVTQAIGITKTDNGYILSGKIKNITSEAITLNKSDTRVFLNGTYSDSTTDEFETRMTFTSLGGTLTLAPNEEYDLSNESIEDYYSEYGITINKINKIEVQIGGGWSVLYSSSRHLMPFQIFLGTIGILFFAVFTICAIGNLLYNKRIAKRNASINEFIKTLPEGSIFASCTIQENNGAIKTAKKQFLSILGAMFMSLFLGFGFYKIYMNGTRYNAFVTKDGILIFDIKTTQFKTENMTIVEKQGLSNLSLKLKKRKLIMIDNDEHKTNVVFNLKDCSASGNELLNAINNFYIKNEDNIESLTGNENFSEKNNQ